MNDAELIACAAIVEAYRAGMEAENQDRARRDLAVAYPRFPDDGWKYVEALQAALSLRGVVPTVNA